MTAEKIGLREKIAYGLGDSASSMFWKLFSMYLMFYYTEVFADYSEWKTGRRATGLVFSASSMSQKFGWTMGSALVGFLLSFFGYVADAIQSARALQGMMLMMSFLPAAGAAISGLFMMIYPLDEKTNGKIAADLKGRRAAMRG
jgi:GPH family glycoside/pentoside/hexuronide:cation symporter